MRTGIPLLFLLILMQGANSYCADANGAPFGGQEAAAYPSTVVNADFDGDSRPDVAVGNLRGLGYTIEIQFTTRTSKTLLTLAGVGIGTRIFACDVDRDSYQDLVVTTATSLLPIAVYLGDGKGHFQEGRPWAFLPFLLDAPYRYEPGGVRTSVASLLPRNRVSAHLPSDLTFTANPDTGTKIAADFENLQEQRPAGGRTPRSPPVATTLDQDPDQHHRG